MAFSIFELEARQEGDTHRSQIIDVTSCMLMMTLSFSFCAVFVSTVLGTMSLGALGAVLVITKAVFFAGVMVMASALLASVFKATLVRRLNAMVLGMFLAFGFVIFNL